MTTQPYHDGHYLAGKDDDLLDDPSSLVLQELLNDVDTEGTSPDDGEVGVSRHDLTLFVVCAISGCDFWGYQCHSFIYLSSF